MKSMEHLIERLILASRWLLVVFYLGLAVGLALYGFTFFMKLWYYATHLTEIDENQAIVKILSLIDASLVASLVVMVIIAGYENFVSKLDENKGSKELSWLGTIDAASLKIKVASTIVAISSIHLLQVFLDIKDYSDTKIMLLTLVHMAFIISALMLAYMDKIVHSYGAHAAPAPHLPATKENGGGDHHL
jgi:uncharacterized protein (TIGR00645 family)